MRRSLCIALVLAAAVVAAGAASGSPKPAKLMLRSTSLGRVLVDARGHTLYLFGADKGRKSTCYGACAAEWPPLLTASKPLAGLGLKNGLLATTKRKDGRLQVVYAGHPLYFFRPDTRAGQTRGQGLDFFGGTWFVVSSAGKKITSPSGSAANGASAGGGTTTTPPDNGGYGYGYPPY